MSAEEWEMSPYVVATCPGCGNQTPQSELAWASREDWEPITWESGEEDYYLATTYWHFTQCVTCDRPSIYSKVDNDDLASSNLVWPQPELWATDAPSTPPEQQHLAAAADLLATRGQERAAALLLECVNITYRQLDIGFRGDLDSVYINMAVLHVPPPLRRSFRYGDTRGDRPGPD